MSTFILTFFEIEISRIGLCYSCAKVVVYSSPPHRLVNPWSIGNGRTLFQFDFLIDTEELSIYITHTRV